MNRYPTDEELYSLIEELEQEKLYAPRHLKEEILQKAAQTKAEAESKRKKASPVSLFTYRLKIVAGMAAAIFLVFMIPAKFGNDFGPDRQIKAQRLEQQKEEEKEREKASKNKDRIDLSLELHQRAMEMNEAANHIFSKINNALNLNHFGGKNNEN